MHSIAEYQRVRDGLTRDMCIARNQGQPVGLRKSTSNLFRTRDESRKRKIDVSSLHHVLRIDPDKLLVDVEGMITYEELVRQTLAHGLLPAVTPELKTITAGGAVSGLAIESSSFRFGLVHETVEDMEVLVGDGTVAQCSRETNQDLFCSLPNSYGTLGYVLRLRLRLMPAKRYVALTHERYSDVDDCFRAIASAADDPSIDFLDGTVFARGEIYMTSGRMRDTAPRTSKYTYLGIYYKSIASKSSDYLSTADYIWRWDTDWFWCSKQFHAQHAAVRLFATPRLLNSLTYQRIMRLSNRVMTGPAKTESVIQDVAIPIGNAPEFLRFLLSDIRITPIWLCPFRIPAASGAYTLYPMDAGRLYINFGFWDVLPKQSDPAHYNKKIEAEAQALNGRKALYSSSYYDRDTFESFYDVERYKAVKKKYDPDGLFGDLYQKCVLRK
jgi:FAD/FMN-containing dehydrogenase